MESNILLRLLLTVIFGAILGLETETRVIESKGKKEAEETERQRLGGVRTYTILALIGGVAGIIFRNGEVVLAYLTFVALLGLVLGAYVLNVKFNKAFGLTTEVGILVTFLIGFLTTSDLVTLDVALFILIILAFFLSQKRGVGAFIHKFQHKEIIDVFKFGLTAAVILPLLPNQTYFIRDIFQVIELNWHELGISESVANLSILNPFRVWLIVVVISGINLGGYLLSKLIGAGRGILLTSILGGLVSSTSTTYAFSHKSKKENASESTLLAGAVLVANGMSFITISVLMSIISIALFKSLILPLVGFFAASIAIGLAFIVSSQKKHGKTHSIDIQYEPFSVGPAIKFVAIIVLVTFFIQIIQLFNNDAVLAFITALSGVTGMDAPTIAIGELINRNALSVQMGSLIFLSTNAVNFIFKSIIALRFGSKEFARRLIVGLVLVVLCSLLLLVK